MTGKKRKPLDDSLAKDFVFGGDENEDQPLNQQEEIEQAVLTNTDKKNKKLSLMEKLQVQPKESTTRFTVDLKDSMHRKLSILAAKTGRSKADIVRTLLDEALIDIDE